MITFGPVEPNEHTFYSKENIELKIGGRNFQKGCFSMNPKYFRVLQLIVLLPLTLIAISLLAK